MNIGVVDWAYQQSSSQVKLSDDKNLQALRSQYVGFRNAQHAPMIIEGDVMAASTFWIGNLLNAWAGKWVDYWTSGHGVFTMSAQEDAAYLEALHAASRANKVDLSRVLVLRSGSNFTTPPPGKTAAEMLHTEVSFTGISWLYRVIDVNLRSRELNDK